MALLAPVSTRTEQKTPPCAPSPRDTDLPRPPFCTPFSQHLLPGLISVLAIRPRQGEGRQGRPSPHSPFPGPALWGLWPSVPAVDEVWPWER